jgi:hypothetical protein
MTRGTVMVVEAEPSFQSFSLKRRYVSADVTWRHGYCVLSRLRYPFL